jgi:hypothetical protein
MSTKTKKEWKRITRKQVLARLEDIKCMDGDCEMAHSAADKLYLDVMKTIASYGGHPGALARTVLHVEEIEFDRWCA